jgi:CHRD domain-containing protein
VIRVRKAAGRRTCGALATIVLAIGVTAPISAFGSTAVFRAELKGSNMVPPTASAGSGYVRATYDTVSRKLSWSGTQSGLSSKITHIDFHGPASPAKAAGVVQPIKSLSGGSTTLSETEAADLFGGYWNITIHTRSHPEGEVRGQVVRGE